MDSQSLPGGIEFQRKAEQKRPSMAPVRQMVRGPLDPMSIRTPHVSWSLLYNHTQAVICGPQGVISLCFSAQAVPG